MKRTDLPFMPEFYDRYINLVPEELDVVEALQQTEHILENHKEELIRLQEYRYQEGKWTCKELVQHMIDTERIMSYRALAIARGEMQVLPGFEENGYAENSYANERSMESLLEEFLLLRKTTILLFQGFQKETLLNRGYCATVQVTALSLGLVCVGHAKHHVGVLEERYF